MKRKMIFGLMLASAFALTNCSEQLVSPDLESDIIVDETIENGSAEDVRIPYEVIVNEPTTKTISDGTNVFWMDEATAVANGLGKTAVDKVNLFSRPAEDDNYILHNPFYYAGNQRFVGELKSELGTTNNWYCIYPYDQSTTLSSEDEYDIVSRLSIGATSATNYIQMQMVANKMYHIAGTTCPMYCYKANEAGSETPKFSMTHLSALLAIKIENKGKDADIVINGIEVDFPSEYVVGEFDLKIKGTNVMYTPVSGRASKNAVLSLGGATISVAPEETATFYMAIKPCVVKAGKNVLTVKINGSSKQITLENDLNFVRGSMTTLNVPLTLTESIETNIFDFGVGSLTNASQEQMYVNGHKVDAYVLGSAAETGQVKIAGGVKELINMVPVTFYASSYANTQGVMRVESIGATIKWGIIDVPISFTYDKLCTMMQSSRITFSGLLPLEQYKRNGETYITIFDENPILKEIDKESIDSLLTNFAYKDKSNNLSFTPTFDGLQQAINDPSLIHTGITKDVIIKNSTTDNLTTFLKNKPFNDAADTTAFCIYRKVQPILADKINTTIVGWLLPDAKTLVEYMCTASADVVLSTVDRTAKVDGLSTALPRDNRVIAWGIHAKEE